MKKKEMIEAINKLLENEKVFYFEWPGNGELWAEIESGLESPEGPEMVYWNIEKEEWFPEGHS